MGGKTKKPPVFTIVKKTVFTLESSKKCCLDT